MSLAFCNTQCFRCHRIFSLTRKSRRHEWLRLLSSAQPTGSKVKKSKGGGKYSDSLNLPQMPYALSEFKPDGRCNERERYIHKVADFEGLYEWQQENNSGPAFTIHDGPPYANGSPHVGHALNKIIKDVINRYKVMRGHKVNFVPGWDCHGLPIELKARVESESQLSSIEVRKQAHNFSRQTLDLQRAEFKSWGVMADWDNPYITSDASYVQNELDVFQKLYEKGLIYQDYMPVYWSPSSKTALAEAELEYNAEHCSPSVYVRLPLTSIPDELKAATSLSTSVDIIIWTTTAWTLPANQAVCFSPNLQYCLVKHSDQHCIVASDLLQQVFDKLATKYEVVTTFSGSLLSGHTYRHPIYGDRQCPLLAADHVTCDVGTGFVHTAPAHGHDDFKVALKHDLDRECMVDEEGFYTSMAGEHFAGKHVFEQGNDIVTKLLGSYLLYTEQYTHKYPYDWRTKQPVFIRASQQWFIDTNSLREPALKALNDVEVSPSVYKAPMCETISQRPYWCISRQRAWGVPIPAFTDQHGNTHIHRAITHHLQQLVAEHGIDIWWQADDETLLPDRVKKKAGISDGLTLQRNLDILDIWFDSGVTWSAVLGTTPADIYIEGVDQIRGWFQSSLLTSVALNGTAPYKSVMMHGFTVDEDGQKMSKSAGNVVAPGDVIHGNKTDKPGYGVDVLRWWAASKYSSTNVDIGPNMIRQCNDKMLQMRKRMRFILGNVHDFTPNTHQLDYPQLLCQDQYFLHVLHDYATKISACYERRELSAVLKWLELFMAKFSNQYATSCKDRLYCFPSDGVERRSAQTVLHHTFTFIVHSAAPILPFFAEDCYIHRYGNQLNKGVNIENSKSTISVFRNGWFELDQRWDNSKLAERFQLVYRMLEELRAAIGSKSLETLDVVIACDNDVYSMLQELQEEADIGELCSHSPLCETMQCASLGICTSEERDQFDIIGTCDACYAIDELKVKVYVKESSCVKCERCRRFTAITSAEPCQTCLLNVAGSWAA